MIETSRMEQSGLFLNDGTRIILRRETDADIPAIRDVTVAAFETLAISNQTEHFIIEALRTTGALSLSLVAEREGWIVGHIAFSSVNISDGTRNWYGLGPVSVLPIYQRMGLGKALVREGLARLKALGAKGCCLVGDPNYYERFGFKHFPELVHPGVPRHFFLAIAFEGTIPRVEVEFHEAFKADRPPSRE